MENIYYKIAIQISKSLHQNKFDLLIPFEVPSYLYHMMLLTLKIIYINTCNNMHHIPNTQPSNEELQQKL